MAFIPNIHIDALKVLLVELQDLVVPGDIDHICVELAGILKHCQIVVFPFEEVDGVGKILFKGVLQLQHQHKPKLLLSPEQVVLG
jgi:hypothetical protein